jgi:hypothetical protein
VKLAASDPLALLHIRCLADERISTGWSDKREEQPKMWAALGPLTIDGHMTFLEFAPE